MRGKGRGEPLKPRQQAPKAKKPKPEPKPVDGPQPQKAESEEKRGSNILSEDQQRALFFNHKSLYERSLATKKEADAALRNTCKLIKSEGGAVADIKLAIQLDTVEGEREAKARIERELQVARWVGAPFGHQFQMFEEELAATDRAFETGKIDGLKGVARRPPYAPELPQYRRYMEGYMEGQAVLAKKFAPKDEPKPPEEAPVVH
jgi:hypothetical protein